jgi:hypothetical protein
MGNTSSITYSGQKRPNEQENIFPFEPYKIYYLATPYNVFGAGKALMDAMKMPDASNN